MIFQLYAFRNVDFYIVQLEGLFLRFDSLLPNLNPVNSCRSLSYISIRPANYVALWEEWMSKCKDWCISRQLWWGHRIPAWQNTANGEWRVPLDSEEQRYFEEVRGTQNLCCCCCSYYYFVLFPLRALLYDS